jgi:hypothetical protein
MNKLTVVKKDGMLELDLDSTWDKITKADYLQVADRTRLKTDLLYDFIKAMNINVAYIEEEVEAFNKEELTAACKVAKEVCDKWKIWTN